MYTIIKVLNNNTVLAKHDHEEIIVMFKGIGFGKKAGECLEIPPQAKKYLMQKTYQSKDRFQNIIEYIDPIYLEITDEILKRAEARFAKIDYNILLPLADHIFFTMKRMKENILPSNPFHYDIQLLFPDEYEVAQEARDIIFQYTSQMINDDEVGFITLHVHSAVSTNKVVESMDVHSISYARLMNHIKFLIVRINTGEKLQMDISEFTKDKFPFAYQQAQQMCDSLSKILKKEMPETEVGYLALHLERILSSTVQ